MVCGVVDNGKQKGGLDIIQITVAIVIGILFKLPAMPLYPTVQEIETH